MHEVNPGYLRYWPSEEVLVFLKSLLEQERGGTKAFANIGQAVLIIRVVLTVAATSGLPPVDGNRQTSPAGPFHPTSSQSQVVVTEIRRRKRDFRFTATSAQRG